MLWAGTVACLCVLSVLLIVRELFLRARLPNWSPYLLPPVFLGYGVLSWSLFSGMEVALLMAVWSAALWAFWNFSEDPSAPSDAPLRRAIPLGLCNALLVSTRPEALCWVLIFIVFCLPRLKSLGFLRGLNGLIVISLPPLLVLIAQSVANRIFTGEWSAAGALVKLELNHPYWTLQQAVDSWNFFVEYQIDRMMQHHLALPFSFRDHTFDEPGWLLVWLAAVPLLVPNTRRYAALVWCSGVSWLLLTALNGQVRWQNDRYTVPAVALLLIGAALGLGLLCKFVFDSTQPLLLRPIVALALPVGIWVLATGQYANYRDQVWFCARASRNIYDQHMTVAMNLRSEQPPPRRVLLGDAGAIPYISDLPALDIIGLGGYHDLPFARASRLGVGAIVELIQRMGVDDRPDVMAIYPSWWGDLPSWFGREKFEVPVRGNVICGGAAKVVYAANWEPLEGSESPSSALNDATVIDSVDFADLVSERTHRQTLKDGFGFVVMKLLPDPSKPKRDLWDAGRALPKFTTLSVDLAGVELSGASQPPTQGGVEVRLVLRYTAIPRTKVVLSVNGKSLPMVVLTRQPGWAEQSWSVPDSVLGLPGPGSQVDGKLHVELRILRGELAAYHLWAIQGPSKNR
jgi:hypothetical protein